MSLQNFTYLSINVIIVELIGHIAYLSCNFLWTLFCTNWFSWGKI